MSDADAHNATMGVRNMEQPLLDWLTANGLELDTVVMWPRIEFDEPNGRMRVECVMRRDGEAVVMKWPGSDRYNGGYAPTEMVDMPLLVPMSEELRTAWEGGAAEQRTAQELRNLMYMLNSLTVVVPRPGNQLLFVASHGYEPTQAAVAKLREMLPAHQVDVITGMNAVILVDPMAKPVTLPVSPPAAMS